MLSIAGEASAQATAVVSPDGARFTIPIGRKATGPWQWYREDTPTNSAEYVWHVRIAERYSVGFALFKYPGAIQQEGSFDDLLRAGQANIAALTPTGGHAVRGYTPVIGRSGDTLVIEINDRTVIDTLFKQRPRTVVMETISPYSARRLLTVRVTYVETLRASPIANPEK